MMPRVLHADNSVPEEGKRSLEGGGGPVRRFRWVEIICIDRPRTSANNAPKGRGGDLGSMSVFNFPIDVRCSIISALLPWFSRRT